MSVFSSYINTVALCILSYFLLSSSDMMLLGGGTCSLGLHAVPANAQAKCTFPFRALPHGPSGCLPNTPWTSMEISWTHTVLYAAQRSRPQREVSFLLTDSVSEVCPQEADCWVIGPCIHNCTKNCQAVPWKSRRREPVHARNANVQCELLLASCWYGPI